MSERARGWGLLGAVVAVGVALDQITKQLADAHLRAGLNIAGGQLTHPGVARAHGLPWRPAEDVLGLS